MPDLPPDRYEQVHVSNIRAGDTILIDGVMKTICPKDLTYDYFIDHRLWGDSYRLGTIPITRVVFGAEIARTRRKTQ